MRAYSLYDKKAGSFGYPVFYVNDSIAVADCQVQLSNVLSDNPNVQDLLESLDLYFIGDFDLETGDFVKPEKPVFVAKAFNFKEVEVNEA